MPPTPPTSEPKTLIIGANWEWDRTYSDGPPSDGYTLKYDLHGQSSLTTIAAATSAAGDYYEVREAKAATVDLEPGTYVMVGYVEKGTARFEIYRAELHLQRDLTDAGVVDAQTRDEKVLAQINAAVETLTLNPFSSTQVDDQRVDYNDLGDLLERQGTLRARVAMARNQGQLPKRKVSFGAVS